MNSSSLNKWLPPRQVYDKPNTEPHTAHRRCNHMCILLKILELTKYIRLTEVIESMLENRYFYLELGSKKSRLRRFKNGLPQVSALAPFFFDIYTNDQPRSEGTRRSVYADDLGVAAQDNYFKCSQQTDSILWREQPLCNSIKDTGLCFLSA